MKETDPKEIKKTPVLAEVVRFMSSITSVEISTTNLLFFLDKNALDQSRRHEMWPDTPSELAFCLRHIRSELEQFGIAVKYRAHKRKAGTRWKISKIEAA